MGTYSWAFTLVTVALLLDPTFGDVLVQPGYGQPGQAAAKNTVAQSKSLINQQLGNAQQNYYLQQHPALQMMQQEHALQQYYLKLQHQQEQNQLLQLQQQQLQNPATYPHGRSGEQMVGTPWGVSRPHSIVPLPFGGGLGHGKLFSLGPLGLQSFRLGGLGGLGGFPVLMSPNQQFESKDSTQSEKSMAEPTQARTKRDVGERRESSGNKYDQKNRLQSNRMATNPSLRSNLDITTQNTQPSKTEDHIVGEAQKQGDETVGSSLLDPLGLVEKTEDLIEDLKSGHLPNPLKMLSKGDRRPWLNKENSGNSQFEEHVVGQPQQYSPQYAFPPSREGPVVGDVRQMPYSAYPSSMGRYDQPQPYGAYARTYPAYGQPWMHRSNSMTYRGNQMTGASNPSQEPNTQRYSANSLVGAQNPSARNPVLKFSMSNSDRASTVGKAQEAIKETNGSGKSLNSENIDPIIGAPNPSSGIPPEYSQMVGSPNPMMNGFYELAREAQPILGRLFDLNTGSSSPAAYGGGPVPGMGGGPMGERSSMVGNSMMNSFYDPYRQANYNGPQNYRHFDFDDIFDDRGYNHNHMHNGGYDRIYGSHIQENPYGYGGGYPYHIHNHHGYIV